MAKEALRKIQARGLEPCVIHHEKTKAASGNF